MIVQFKKNIFMLAFLLASVVLAATNATANPDPSETATAAKTAPQDPIVMLKSVTNNVLRALKEHHINKDSSLKQLDVVVDQYILPYVDFNEMSTWVAGRKIWSSASQKTRDEFVKQFKTLVVRTYATALNSYSNEVVEFGPQKIDTHKNRVQVSSYIKRANKENIRVDYRLIKHGDSWLVYDVIIEGVSILQGFQAQFSDKIRNGGLDPVIKEIKDHNALKQPKAA